jgi:hypothetical protein
VKPVYPFEEDSDLISERLLNGRRRSRHYECHDPVVGEGESIQSWRLSFVRYAQRALLKPLQNQAHTFKWVP